MNSKMEKKFKNIIKEYEREQEPPEFVNTMQKLLNLDEKSWFSLIFILKFLFFDWDFFFYLQDFFYIKIELYFMK